LVILEAAGNRRLNFAPVLVLQAEVWLIRRNYSGWSSRLKEQGAKALFPLKSKANVLMSDG
jgi:hypothetical protein